VKRYGRNPNWLVKRNGKYRRKLWKDRENMEENSEMIIFSISFHYFFLYFPFLPYFPYHFTISLAFFLCCTYLITIWLAFLP
jgi:hypothetical protein